MIQDLYSIRAPFGRDISRNVVYNSFADNSKSIYLGYLGRPKEEDEHEIPAILFRYTEKSGEDSPVVFQLYSKKAVVRSTCSYIPTIFNSRYSRIIGLVKYSVGKLSNITETFYVGPGMIFDNESNPILLYTMNVHKKNVIDPYEEYPVDIKSMTIRISPEVYKKDSPLKKWIVNQFIPSIVDTTITDPYNPYTSSTEYFPRIIIDNISNWVVKSSNPVDIVDFADDVKNFLASDEAINEILFNI